MSKMVSKEEIFDALNNAFDNVENFDKWSDQEMCDDIFEYYASRENIKEKDMLIYIKEWKESKLST